MADYLFVHAGVDLTMEDWRQTAPKDFCGFVNPFIKGKIIQARPLFLVIPLPDVTW